jgi:hypothetical protein
MKLSILKVALNTITPYTKNQFHQNLISNYDLENHVPIIMRKKT